MTIEEARRLVADRMDQIKLYFKPGVKITVLVRVPGYPDRDFVMTDDSLSEIAAMVERSSSRDATPPDA